MTESFCVACVQTSSRRRASDNIAEIVPLIGEAAVNGAQLVLLPETVDMVEPDRALMFDKAQTEANHEALAAFRQAADAGDLHLLIGSLVVKTDDNKQMVNRSYLIGPSGDLLASYDKLHMFDVDLDGGESYRESAYFQPGKEAVIGPTPWGGLGMTICYDLRFPYLYRKLAQKGALFFSVPAAFTRPTGKAHWRVLLRARAVETGSYVFAAAQCGEHAEGRLTHGHSLIVDPWGDVLAEAGAHKETIYAQIDPARASKVRRMIPSLTDAQGVW